MELGSTVAGILSGATSSVDQLLALPHSALQSDRPMSGSPAYAATCAGEPGEPGSISFKGISIGCMVLNISTGGARLLLASDAAIPFAFDLEISGEHGRRRGLIVWRNDRQIGVVFDLDERFGNRGKSDEAEAATATVNSPALVPALSDDT